LRTARIASETVVGFKQGSKLGVHGDMKPNRRSLIRWSTKGLKRHCDKHNKPITLEYCYIGGYLYTSVEAFGRWLKKINKA
jgi:hypothetical protein